MNQIEFVQVDNDTYELEIEVLNEFQTKYIYSNQKDASIYRYIDI